MVFAVVAILAGTLALFAPTKPEKWFIATCLTMGVVSMITVFATKRSEPKPNNWMTCDVLFASTFSIVHFAYFVYWMFGAIPTSMEIWYYRGADCPDRVCFALAMFVVSLNSFLFGYNLTPTSTLPSTAYPPSHSPTTAKKHNWIGRILLRAGLLLFVVFILSVGPERFFGAYAGTNTLDRDANVYYALGIILTNAGLAAIAASLPSLRNATSFKHVILSGMKPTDAVFLAVVLMAITIHGDRSTVLYIMITALVAYCEYIRPIRLRILSVLALTLITAFGVIVATRGAKERQYDFSPVKAANDAFLNFGSSTVCGLVAIDYTHTNGFYNGRMQISQLAGILPYGRRIFNISNTIHDSSSRMLTRQIQGRIGKGVSGTGTTAFADIYFDFGAAGAVISFFLVGALAKHTQNRARTTGSLPLNVAYIVLVSYITLSSRYSFAAGIARDVVYGGVATFILCRVSSVPTATQTRHRARTAPRPTLTTVASDTKCDS